MVKNFVILFFQYRLMATNDVKNFADFENMLTVTSSHSPLFLLGMDKEYGSSDYEIYHLCKRLNELHIDYR